MSSSELACIWTQEAVYNRATYRDEADLEAAILHVSDQLFGSNRIYLDIKKKIGAKGSRRNIPDGYLIDLSGSMPRLFVVENELAAHDPLRHVAVQILQFSLSFEADPRVVKKVLLDALHAKPDARQQCERYARSNEFRNVDHLLDWLVFEGGFTALVIIDDIAEKLENVLVRKFQFGVEVLQLVRYRNSRGDTFYHFEPFLADLTEGVAGSDLRLTGRTVTTSSTDVDTIVVPAREEGFQEVFIGEDRWHEVRIHGSMRPQIKYVAAYRVAPVSAINHIASVKSIEPWKDTGKFVINFAEPAREFGPIPMLRKGKVKTFQSLRYTTQALLKNAKSLDDLW